VVLSGGTGARLGGADKAALELDGTTLLEHALAATRLARETVVVGAEVATSRSVAWTREDPPGGGPLAALDAGLRHVTRETLLVVSADLPFLRRSTVGELLAAVGDGGTEAAVGHDGRDQPLCGAYRTEPLRRELALLHTEHGTLRGLPLRLLLPQLTVRRVTTRDALDCDTWDDLAAARARIREHGRVLDEWIEAVKAELGIEIDLDQAELLDLARDAAHSVARPAAPLSTFLVGYAAAKGDGTPAAIAEAARQIEALAARWRAE
jgi:molybdopterin-guanine dinucleotide biosynthesis protein A